MDDCYEMSDFYDFDETAIERLTKLLSVYKGCTIQYNYMPITGGTITKRTDGILAEVTNKRFLIETQWDMKCRWWENIDENDIVLNNINKL